MPRSRAGAPDCRPTSVSLAFSPPFRPRLRRRPAAAPGEAYGPTVSQRTRSPADCLLLQKALMKLEVGLERLALATAWR